MADQNPWGTTDAADSAAQSADAWGSSTPAAGVDLVVECTGFYTSQEKSQAHLDAGAKKVLISAPAGEMKTIVFNVNDDTITASDTITTMSLRTVGSGSWPC
jgi:glyceraldehyde-3-phosphate dehydrogenase/erythrose-4-phosphate dehydrogenase